MKKVLLIDDSREFLDLMEEVISDTLAEVELIDKPSEAYEKIQQDGYDFIFLDYNLGSMKAVDFLQVINKGAAKIYIVSGYDFAFLKEALKEQISKVDGILDKSRFTQSVVDILKNADLGKVV